MNDLLEFVPDGEASLFVGGVVFAVVLIGLLSWGVGYMRAIFKQVSPNNGKSIADRLEHHLEESARMDTQNANEHRELRTAMSTLSATVISAIASLKD